MGGLPSRPQFQRTKSLSTFGRSSQRSLFQKSKAKLKKIDKKLEKLEDGADSASLDEIKQQLEDVHKELTGVSPALKEKNKNKFDDVVNHLQELREKFESKITPIQPNEELLQVCPAFESGRQTVELTLVKVVAPEEDPDVQIRKPLAEVTEANVEERSSNEPESPKVKFGIQVMPINPRISQDLLKRRTLPENEGPKAEFEKLRVISDSAVMSSSKSRNKPSSIFYTDELYKSLMASNRIQENGTYRVSSEEAPRKPPRVAEKTSQERNSLQQIESIGQHIDELENELKYFNGNKEDQNYAALHESFVKSMLKLDNVDTYGDPVVKQERKISIRRVQDLITILDRLVETSDENGNVGDKSDDKSQYDYVGERLEENINLEGKPVAATAL